MNYIKTLEHIGAERGERLAQVEANARLMAAAPAMLDALRGLIGAIEQRDTNPGFASAGNYVRALESARSAIAKATA
jgi:hypothetical protein